MTEKFLFCTYNQDACAECKALTGLLYDPDTAPSLPIHNTCFSYYLDLDVSENGLVLIHHHPDIASRIAEVAQRTHNIQAVIDDLYGQIRDLPAY